MGWILRRIWRGNVRKAGRCAPLFVQDASHKETTCPLLGFGADDRIGANVETIVGQTGQWNAILGVLCINILEWDARNGGAVVGVGAGMPCNTAAVQSAAAAARAARARRQTIVVAKVATAEEKAQPTTSCAETRR